MSDLFTRLSRQAQGVDEGVRPLTLPLFAPPEVPAEVPVGWPKSSVEVERSEEPRQAELRADRVRPHEKPAETPRGSDSVTSAAVEPLPSPLRPAGKLGVEASHTSVPRDASAPREPQQPVPREEERRVEPRRVVQPRQPERESTAPAPERLVHETVVVKAGSEIKSAKQPSPRPAPERPRERSVEPREPAVVAAVRSEPIIQEFVPPPAPVTRISIGRVEVRAVLQQPAPARAPRRAGPAMPLSDYLQKRNGKPR